jgi:DNA-directed RNA polymerase specialized sigma24 family protein
MGNGRRDVTSRESEDSVTSESEGSVTRCVLSLRSGDAAAATLLWERYFALLVRVAKQRLARTGSTGAEADEEDAALSAFVSFCGAAAEGQFPDLSDREELWRLLVVITARKVGDQVDRRRALKRGGHLLRVEGALANGLTPGLTAALAREPNPDVAAMVAEETRLLLERLGNSQLQAIALWRMEGYTIDEIAVRLGCTRRTVARKLELIREAWKGELE